MATLYQIQGNMNNLKSLIQQLKLLWQDGDSILLLADTVAFIDWLHAYLIDCDIDNVHAIYALQADIDNLNQICKDSLIDHPYISQILSDEQWVALTLPSPNTSTTLDTKTDTNFDKIVTLSHGN